MARASNRPLPAPRVLAWLKVAGVAHEILPAAFALGEMIAALGCRTGILLIRGIEIPCDGFAAFGACVSHRVVM
jgi:hypothetical protein